MASFISVWTGSFGTADDFSATGYHYFIETDYLLGHVKYRRVCLGLFSMSWFVQYVLVCSVCLGFMVV